MEYNQLSEFFFKKISNNKHTQILFMKWQCITKLLTMGGSYLEENVTQPS